MIRHDGIAPKRNSKENIFTKTGIIQKLFDTVRNNTERNSKEVCYNLEQLRKPHLPAYGIARKTFDTGKNSI